MRPVDYVTPDALATILGAIGMIIPVLANAGYVLAAWRCEVTPSKVTWGVWALADLVALIAQASLGASTAALAYTFVITIIPVIVVATAFLAPWNPYRRADPQQLARTDQLQQTINAVCLIGALAALVVQYIEPGRPALIASIVTSGVAAVPTLVRAVRNPHAEAHAPFTAGAVSAALALLTVPPTPEGSWFVWYLLTMCSAIALTVWLGQRIQPAPAAPPVAVVEEVTFLIPEMPDLIMSIIPPEIRHATQVPAHMMVTILGRVARAVELKAEHVGYWRGRHDGQQSSAPEFEGRTCPIRPLVPSG